MPQTAPGELQLAVYGCNQPHNYIQKTFPKIAFKYIPFLTFLDWRFNTTAIC